MPDEDQTLDVYIEEPGGGDKFYFKAEKMDRSLSNSAVIESILEVAGDVAGRDVDLRLESFDGSGVIQNPDDDTYPSLATVNVDTNTYAKATEKEATLAEIFKQWGPDGSGNFAQLNWGPRTKNGILTKLSTTEDVTSTTPEQYTFSFEFTFANVEI